MTVVVVSIDGVAPRFITSATMPFLLALGASGGACYRARTVEPSLTLPAHISMMRGVEPDRHGVLDNAADACVSSDCPASFLSAARQAGHTTAAVSSWSPLKPAFGDGAVTYDLLFDDGYNPDVDTVVTDAAVDLLAGKSLSEVSFVYLIGPDLAGHDHGWGSPHYLKALSQADAELRRLVEALDDVAASEDDPSATPLTIMVTTDHGGSDQHHVSNSMDDLETFVVIRSPSIDPGSTWSEVSILDVAPTVADAAGFEPDGGWAGTSLLGREIALVDYLTGLVERQNEFSYGEQVTMAEHSLQTAERARAAGATDEMTVAALLHDVGHLHDEAGVWGFPDHAEAGARSLQGLLPPQVTEPIRLHVEAKRWLVANEPGYADQLSEASTVTLRQQGGPLDEAASDAFIAAAYAGDAISLRRWDDAGKVAGSPTPSVDDFRPVIASVIGAPTANAVWLRDACRCNQCRDTDNDQHLIGVDELARWVGASATFTAADSNLESGLVTVTVTSADGSASHQCLVPVEIWSPADRSALGTSKPRLAADLRRAWPDRPAADQPKPVEFNTPGWDDDLCCRLAEHGFALLTSVPTAPGTVLEVAAELGFVRETNYGALFDVRHEPRPQNLAYSSVGLPLHTDNPYRQPCPTVQLLHCLRPAAEGGDTVLADGLSAALQLSLDDPDAFATLTSTPVVFRFHTSVDSSTVDSSTAKSPDEVDLQARRALIELGVDGSVLAVNVNHRSMEVPDEHLADRFYPAYFRFCQLLESRQFTTELKLDAGDLIAFDNRRVLHARTSFGADADRHLQGCYIDMDAVHSRARVAKAEMANRNATSRT